MSATLVRFYDGCYAAFQLGYYDDAARSAGATEEAPRLHAALASMTPAVLAYRGLGEVQSALLAWLAAHAKDVPAP